MPVVAGIDIGTQSLKVICYNTDTRKILALTSAGYDLICKEDGSREQEASWWVEAIKSCFSQIQDDIRLSIEAIGVSGQQHGFVPVAADGKVLSRVKLWCDTSTIEECDELTQKAGGEKVLLSGAGNLILPGYTASKILWFKKYYPEQYSKMAKILLPHDYINWYLTGAFTSEYGDASGTGLLDIRNRSWSHDLLAAIDEERDVSVLLPHLLKSDEMAGKVIKSAATELGIREGIMVASGGGDNMMGAIGTGAVTDGTLVISLGTSGTLFGYSSQPVVDPEGVLAAFCSSTGGWLPLLCTMNCTVASELTRNLFSKNLEEFNILAANAPAGSEGVLVIPYFNGERTPNYPRGKGCVVGLTPNNMTEANLCRAAMESAVYGLRYGLEAFVRLNFQAKEIRLIGGGAKSDLWIQMVADIFNLPVMVPAVSEAAAFGAALQGWHVLSKELGQEQNWQTIAREHVKLDATAACTPNAEQHEAYMCQYGKYLQYVAAFSTLFSSDR